MEAMKCRQCSAELPVGSAFCNRCGAAQADFPASGSTPAAPGDVPSPEQTLWTGRYSLRDAVHLWLTWPLWAALVFAFSLLHRFLPANLTLADLWLYLALVAVLPGLVLLGRALVRKWSLSYRLTNHRLFTTRGLLSRRHDELELIRVDDVSVRQGLFQRIAGVGTISLLSTDASNPQLNLEGVAAPLELKELLRAQVRACRARTTFLEGL